MGDLAAQNSLNLSQGFAAALQRAKQIAAKIQPNQQGNMGGGGFKRSHDDSDGPDNKRFTSPDDYGHNSNSNMSGGGAVSGGPANMSQALAQAAAVAARLAATAGNTCEEQLRIPESITNAFMGRASNDTISHIQGDSGCKLQLGQEGDRVVTLRGSRESVTKGRDLIQQMANRNGGGTVEVVLTINMPPPGPTGYPPYQELMIPGTKVGLIIGKGGDTIKQLQEKTGAKMVIIQDGPNQEVIKPLRISGDPQKIEHAKQLVLDLIAQKDLQNQQQMNNRSVLPNNSGPNGGYFGGGNDGEQCEVFVPKIAVGVVIGKGGDMIRKIQAECGCKLQFIQGKNDEPGDRRCLIQGTRQQVEDAKRTIDGLIENVLQRNRNMNSGGNATGASNGVQDNGNSNYGYGYGVNHAQQPAREEITFMIPASKCGIVIGRGGETIKLINQQTGAYCEMDRNAVNPPSEKLFKCKGTAEQVEAARQMIAEKINMDVNVITRKSISGGLPTQQGGTPSYNPNDANNPMTTYQQQWAGYAQQGSWVDQSQQVAGMASAVPNATNQQADYSQQWIVYYKSIGMHREAEMIEQQLKAKQTATVAMPQQQQQTMNAGGVAASGNGQTQDYSAQWAEYYRSIGKLEEAEAIEKQMKANSSATNAPAAMASGANCNTQVPGASTLATPSLANSACGGSGSGGAVASNGGGSSAKDYSAQWVKYYRSIGKHEEADALEKQIKNKQNAGNASGGGNTNVNANVGGNVQNTASNASSGTYTDYTQYSQYYAAAQGGYSQTAAGGYGAPGYPGTPQPPGSGSSDINQGSSNHNNCIDTDKLLQYRHAAISVVYTNIYLADASAETIASPPPSPSSHLQKLHKQKQSEKN